MRKLLLRIIPSKRHIVEMTILSVRWADRRLPPVMRSVVGVPLMIGGIFSFLPVLGLWMLPAGMLLVALDVPLLRRRLLEWVARHENALGPPDR